MNSNSDDQTDSIAFEIQNVWIECRSNVDKLIDQSSLTFTPQQVLHDLLEKVSDLSQFVKGLTVSGSENGSDGSSSEPVAAQKIAEETITIDCFDLENMVIEENDLKQDAFQRFDQESDIKSDNKVADWLISFSDCEGDQHKAKRPGARCRATSTDKDTILSIGKILRGPRPVRLQIGREFGQRSGEVTKSKSKAKRDICVLETTEEDNVEMGEGDIACARPLSRELKPEGWELRTRPNSIEFLSFTHFLQNMMDEAYHVELTYVESQAKFCVGLIDRMQMYDTMTDSLQEIANHMLVEGVRLTNILAGTPCIARYSVDDRFYRAIVISEGFDSVFVNFIDYGNHAIVDYDDLLGLPESLADLPAMALECALDGVHTRDLTHSLVTKFKRDFPEGRKLIVKPTRPKFNLEETDKWLVEIYEYTTLDNMSNKYRTPKYKKQKTQSIQCAARDDDDEGTLVDGDTLVDVDW